VFFFEFFFLSLVQLQLYNIWRVTFRRTSAAVTVRVVVGGRQRGMTAHRRGGLPRQAVVRGNEPLLHPLLLLHPAVLEPDLDLGLVEL
jgi:hypothetical protein